MEKYSEKRPWGEFERFTLNELSTVKILTINSGEAFSLQYHKNREEYWRVLSGEGLFTVGDIVTEGREGDEFFIKKEIKHRISNNKKEKIKVLEIAFGTFDEGDTIRLEDKYSRK